ncbi:MAG: uncharacterized protein KVP18_003080 [Porospora cf. gigantea A]|uniref:uncharacterized protein n=1 Tax=Porospora cf. gigantea A TaxID=2853593 RepID=UPI00355AC979|nr:MAG: hypothetical protein KVP18_003080 [Porospora cf. gigantea A]
MRSESVLVSGSAVALLAASVLNQLYFKKITSVMPNYSLFLNLLTSSVYVPFFGLIVAYNWGGYPAALRRFPQRKFVVMALIDALSSALMLIGGTYTPGSTQVILGQTSVPISMLLTFICLRVRYSSNQIAGAVIVLLGVSISKISLQPSETSGHVIFIVVFLLSVVPATFSNLYKVCIITSHFIIMEIAFTRYPMDVYFVSFFVALYQIQIALFLLPLQSLPILGAQAIDVRDIPMSLSWGLQCYLYGTNSIVRNCGPDGLKPCDECAGAFFVVSIYMLVNMLYNLASLVALKFCGTTVVSLVLTLRVPISTWAFSQSWVMGDAAKETVKMQDIVGVAVLISGLALFSVTEESTDDSPKAWFNNTFHLRIAHLPATDCRQLASTGQTLRSQFYFSLAVAPDSFYGEELRANLLNAPSSSDLTLPAVADDVGSFCQVLFVLIIICLVFFWCIVLQAHTSSRRQRVASRLVARRQSQDPAFPSRETSSNV